MIEEEKHPVENNDINEQLELTTSVENRPDSPVKHPRHVKINYACICFFAFLMGADFAVIIPTLWDRLNIDVSCRCYSF